jgi:LAO/AO transport system kinase
VLTTIATSGQGSEAVAAAVDRHAAYLRRSGAWQQREAERLQNGLELLVQQALVDRWRSGVSDERLAELVARLCARRITPYAALNELI